LLKFSLIISKTNNSHIFLIEHKLITSILRFPL